MNKHENQTSNSSPAEFIDPIVQSLDETLSEFELHALLAKTAPASEGYKKLSRLYAVSAVLNKEFPSQMNTGFSNSVMSAIENEALQEQSKPWLHGVKQVASIAVAASVAVLSLLLYQGAIDQSSDATMQETSVAFESKPMQPANISVVPSFPVDFSASHSSGYEQPSSSSSQQQEDLIIIPLDVRTRQ
jgi:negative regulator of sigma E activity|tara:strand:+ start:22630 stop:23196 length:567 start_codon:yes stop_codon:yes gene_type:complete